MWVETAGEDAALCTAKLFFPESQVSHMWFSLERERELPDSVPKKFQKCQILILKDLDRGIANTSAIWRKIAQNFCKLAGK